MSEVCPQCGHCPTCGRSNTAPYLPSYPNYPGTWKPFIWPGITWVNTAAGPSTVTVYSHTVGEVS